MLDKLKRKFIKTFTHSRLYPLLAVPYWALHPSYESIFFIPQGDNWLQVRENGAKVVIPKSRTFRLQPQPHERYFKVNKGDTVLDVGACIGEFAVPAGIEVGEEGKVIALEPDPQNLAKLYANITINKLQDTTQVVEKAAWNRKETLELYKADRIGHHSLISFDEGTPGGKSVEQIGEIDVQADKLDNIISELGVDKIDFFKMDIEGAELEALEGAGQALSISEKCVIEANHIRGGQKTSKFVNKILEENGFTTKISSSDFVCAVR